MQKGKRKRLIHKINRMQCMKKRCIQINNHYRKHNNLMGLNLTDDEIQSIKSADIINIEDIPFPSWVIQNINNQIISAKRMMRKLTHC